MSKTKQDMDIAVYIEEEIQFIGPISECSKKFNLTRRQIMNQSADYYLKLRAKAHQKRKDVPVFIRLDDYEYS